MDGRKSPRVINMKRYDYKIFYIMKDLKISELRKGAHVGYCWKIDDLKNDCNMPSIFKEKQSIRSFKRSQKWIKKRHPEYLL